MPTAPRHSNSTMPHRVGWYLSRGDLAEIQGYATIVRNKFAECLIFSGAELVGCQAQHAGSLMALGGGGVWQRRCQ